MSVAIESVVLERLSKLLRTFLPAETVAVNAGRYAQLVSTTRTTVTLAADTYKLKWSTTSRGVDDYSVTLDASGTGELTTTQIATLINAQQSIATVDTQGRLVLTSPSAPGASESVVSLLGDSETLEALVALGFDPGGQQDVRSKLVGPNHKGVMDGFPQVLDPMAIQPGAFIVILGDTQSKPKTSNMRVDIYDVTIDVSIWRAEASGQTHRNREPIRAALRAVRQCLFTDAGRYADAAGDGILRVLETKARIAGTPLRAREAPGRLFDLAQLELVVSIHDRPSSTAA